MPVRPAAPLLPEAVKDEPWLAVLQDEMLRLAAQRAGRPLQAVRALSAAGRTSRRSSRSRRHQQGTQSKRHVEA
jgi:hypothetical protein